MKKTFFTTFFIALAFFTVQAQIGPGTIAVGGALQVTTTTSKSKDASNSVDGPKRSSFVIGPQASYFLSENLSVGARISYSLTVIADQGIMGEEKNISSLFGFSPFARYYVPMGNNFYVFGEGRIGLGFGGSKVKIDGSTNDTGNISNFGISVSPGMVFFPGEKVGIELSFDLLSYTHSVTKDPVEKDNKDIDNRFSFGPNLFSPTLSVQYYF